MASERSVLLKKIIVHIGTHKTGTTSLQDALESQRAELKVASVCYPRTDRGAFPNLAKHSSLFEAAIEGPIQLGREIDMMIREAEGHNCETLVISEEGLSEPHFNLYGRFKDLKKNYDVAILCVTRRQDYFIESIWNQYCKEGHEFRDIKTFADAPSISKRCKYVDILDFWSECGKLTVSDYESVKIKGVVDFFTSSTGVRLKPLHEYSNKSIGMNAALVLASINKRCSDDARFRVLQAFRHDTQKYALGQSLRKSILERYMNHNAVLSQRYGVTFSEDLPVERRMPLLRIDTGVLSDAILNLAKIGVLSH